MIGTGKLAFAGGIVLCSAVMAVAQPRDFTVVAFGGNTQDGMRAAYFTPFAAAKGIRVLEESWDGGIGVIQSRVQAGTPNWDLVEVEAEELALGCFDGLYEKIDWSKIGNKDDFLPQAVSPCGVGTFVWSTALAYDGDALAEGPKSWADFWDVQKFPGQRALRRGPKYTLEFALMADGVPAAEVYEVLATPEGVDRAFAKLDELKPNLVWWEAGAQPLQLLATGEVAMTSVYSGRVAGVNRYEGRNLKIVWEGSIPAVDSWVILKGSPHVDLAHEFIAFASQPERLAQLPEYVAYGPPTKAGTALVREDLRADLPTTPENMEGTLPLDVDFWVDNLEELNQRFNAWIGQ
ncbi:ABC transporter substrate-binding protein [Paenirhodobacter sp.]|uniref:ABC transporter substrate-binding protein n=1 Tax=Paenirhodobacter sp. TaxID=1965326 RepID=UPI003B3E42DD